MARRYECIGESSSSSVQAMDDDIVYVAVGKEVEESKPTLLWVLDNFGGRVCILHVHQPSKSFPLSRLAEHELRETHKILDDYRQICYQAGMPAEKLHIEMDDVAEGIVELVYQHNVKKLVMGAAANKHYSEGMTYLKSKKAMYVRQRVPRLCQIWFICNGHRIHTGGGDLDAVDVEATSPSSVVETGPSNPRSPFQDSGGDSTMISFERTEEERFDQLTNRLEEAILEDEKSKREAYEESVKRGKAEKTAIEAIRRARTFENLYTKELRHRRETEEALAKLKEDLKEMRKQLDEERLTAMNQKLLLENKIASYGPAMEELNDKISSSMEREESYKKERDDLQIEYDNAVKLTEELLRQQADMNQYVSEFSVSEIHAATQFFHPSLKIGEGGYGIIYQGSLRQTEVAIKVVHHSTSLQSPSQFEQEVNLLSKVRHPNLVTLVGICPEILALIYEYLPNGSLEDKLSCTATLLSWQTRIHIATDLCSVLIFLHSSNPCVVHGNLKPRNILLDANFKCKLSDFGTCRALSLRENSINRTDPQGTSPYLEPQFLATGELSPESDIYSFGIILLQLLTGQLLTGRSPLNVANDMKNAVNQDNLNTLLDPSAGDWPSVQARQLALLAVRCCHTNRSRRPDLVSEVWDVLDRMKGSCEAPSSSQPTSEDHSEPPSYFICPILHDVMEDPYMAADGFTYELEGIGRWLNSGHDTSPMTNERLPHRTLVPNFPLRSAIQEWQEQQH